MHKLLNVTKTIFLFLLLFGAFYFLPYCSDSPTEPIKSKSPRDYTWTADTLTYPDANQILMSSIWASSEKDIYICGHSDISQGNLWHFDGSSWTDINIFNILGNRGHVLHSIYGTSSDNIWVVGGKFVRDPQNPLKQTILTRW